MDNFGIHWFRRDLRVAGNLALKKNWQKSNGKVLGVFFFDSTFLSRSDFSHNRFALFLNSIKELQTELQEIGSDLLVIDYLPHQGFEKLFNNLKQSKALQLNTISYNRDYEPFARARDKKVDEIFSANELDVITERDHLIIEPHENIKETDGQYYKVYSPFAKKWFEKIQHADFRKRIEQQKSAIAYLENRSKSNIKKIFSLTWKDLDINVGFKDSLSAFIQANSKQVSIHIPMAGSLAAYKTLKAFKAKIENYSEQRDFPHISGTSHLSMFLKNGSITTSQIVYYLDLLNSDFKNKNGKSVFLKEIAWREFYYSILFHEPRVENEAFLKQYKDLKWSNDKKLFKAWCEGKTGFPIVDAGMRELNTTGWMHNRVRMIVASFLVKDLLIDWRWGEKYFMEKLLDGDLAPNNGGWQWAASTGCDPQPYFRIFNPWLQSARFDPDAKYIKHYVTELKDIATKEIHNEDGNRGSSYPRPVVDHAIQKKKALMLFKASAKANSLESL